VVAGSVRSQKLVMSVKRPRSLPRYTVSGFMVRGFYSESNQETIPHRTQVFI
jgi:hypothetical protein